MNEFAVALVVAVVLGTIGVIVAIRVHHAGWKAGFDEASRVLSDTLCYGCGKNICYACHEKVEMPLGAHGAEAHASREDSK